MTGVIFQCAACRSLTSAGSVILDGDRAGLACSVCGGVTVLPVEREATSAGGRVVVDAEAPVNAPRALPPASALVPAGAAGVAAGGLSVDARERIADRLKKLSASDEQRTLEAMFDNLLGRWSDGAEHKRLLKSASANDQLAFVGQRYRAVLDEVPGDPQAKQAQNDIMTLAMAALSAKKDFGATGEKSNKSAQLVVVVVVAVVACIAMIWLLPRLLPHGADDPAAASDPPIGAPR